MGPADLAQPMERMILSLRLRPEARARLDQLLAAQQDPASMAYHGWLQPSEFAAAFGPDPGDVAKVTSWLKSQGFTIDRVARSGLNIVFSGDVASVQRAFRTPIQRFLLEGREYQANALEPSVPAELGAIVDGVVSMHNLPRKMANTGARPLPLYNGGAGHYLAPGDFATIYDLAPLLATGTDGTGVTLAVVGRTNPGMADVNVFRSQFGLPPGHTTLVLSGPDPGSVSSGENLEADLDLQWSGAAAPGASILFECAGSTSASDGVDLAATHAVDTNAAAILSLSFGSCEAAMGQAELAFYNNLWSQAASQGITVCVAAGDAGAAGCNSGGASAGTGLGVNGLASTPSNTCVGGTMFTDTGGTYWSVMSGPTGGTALGYIPEAAWNESASAGGSGLWAGGGGVSAIYPKPTWQVGPGVPADGFRDVPDLAFSAAGHDGYLVQWEGSLWVVGGTSASTPAFAGIMALMVQLAGERQGNANPLLYGLAATGSPGFHDILAGNNSVPGTPGYAAGPGYDLATGLGSLDVAQLVTSRGSLQLSPNQLVTTQKLGAAFTQAFSVTTGTPPYQFTVTQGPLPPGLTLSTDGLLKGTLDTEGSFPFVLKATDAAGLFAGVSGLIQVGPVTLSASAAAVGELTGQAATFTAAVAGAVDASATWTSTGGTLSQAGPASASFTAQAPGAYTLTATSTANPARTATVQVTVHDADFVNDHTGQPLTGLDALYLAGAEGTQDPKVDLNGDGQVDYQDLALLLAKLGW